MNELRLAFEGPGGEELLAWCVQNGHLNTVIEETAIDVAEHNLVMKLLHEADIRMTPFLPRTPEKKQPKVEENIIDKTLEGDEGG